MSSTEKIVFQGSVLSRAKRNDSDAIKLMFNQFIDVGEFIVQVEYLGVKGIFGMGEHCFGCVTAKRVASIRVSSFGELIYSDGFIEEINSNIIYQPSLFALYFISIILVVATFGIGLLLLPLLVRMFYNFKKCGIVFSVKEGVSVYFSCDRKRISSTCRILKNVTEIRDARIKELCSR